MFEILFLKFSWFLVYVQSIIQTVADFISSKVHKLKQRFYNSKTLFYLQAMIVPYLTGIIYCTTSHGTFYYERIVYVSE